MSEEHALIVGGTRGIGRALANAWCEHRQVSVIARNTEHLDPLPSSVHAWPCDITEATQVKETTSQILAQKGPLSQLVFCQRFRDTGDDWEGELSTTLTATRHLIEMCRDRFSPDGSRSIVVVGSLAARLVSADQPLSYHVAKAGLSQLVRYYALNLAKCGIRVNAVVPSFVFKPEAIAYYQEHPEYCQMRRDLTPLGHCPSTDEVAGVIDFLCSQRAASITGHEIVLDGGLSLAMPSVSSG